MLSGRQRSGTLGAVAPASAQRFPWHAFSKDTVKLQKLTNAALQAAGYCPVPTSGVLDAATCRARDFLGIRVREFFGTEGEQLWLAGHFNFDNPPTCRLDDPSDMPTTPTPGCFEPTGLEGFRKFAREFGVAGGGSLDDPEKTRNWVLIGGTVSALLAVALLFKNKGK